MACRRRKADRGAPQLSRPQRDACVAAGRRRLLEREGMIAGQVQADSGGGDDVERRVDVRALPRPFLMCLRPLAPENYLRRGGCSFGSYLMFSGLGGRVLGYIAAIRFKMTTERRAVDQIDKFLSNPGSSKATLLLSYIEPYIGSAVVPSCP